MGVTIHRLSNGMTVYISTNRQKPQFNAWIAVRAGSRVDPPSSTGLAHYLEHMMFKGTDELATLDYASERKHLDRIAELYDQMRDAADDAARSKIAAAIDNENQADSEYAVANELDQVYAAMGVSGSNAFTFHDMTVYVGEVPANRLVPWATLEAERFRDAVFRQFLPELEAVYEEKNIALDSVENRLSRQLHRRLFVGDAYGAQTTLGSVEHLKTPAYGDMVDFYHRWYVPNNMAIVLAGDIDASTAIPVLEKAFGAWPAKGLEPTPAATLKPLRGRSEVVVEAEGENSVTLAWRLPGVNHPDVPALQVMDLLLANQQAGIIDVDILLAQKLPRAYSDPTFYKDAGYFVLFGAGVEGQSHAEIEKILLAAMAKLKAGDFSQDDIEAVVLGAEMREQLELESNTGRVAKMAAAFWNHTPWERAAFTSASLRKVTRADILRVANTYLGPDFVAVKRVKGKHTPPKITKPAITPVAIDSSKHSAFADKIRSADVVEIEPVWLKEGTDYKRVQLPAGELLYSKNRINDLFSASIRFEVGQRKQKLLCTALAMLERSGTKADSAEQLRRKLWRLGVTVQSSCGLDETSVVIVGIDRNMEESMTLIQRWFAEAKIEKAALAKYVTNALSQRSDLRQEPRTISAALGAFATKAGNSEYLQVVSNKQLKRAQASTLAKLLARLPNTAHKSTYFGPRSAADAAKLLAWGTHHKPTRARKPLTYRNVRGKTHVFFLNKKVAQSQIAVLIPRKPMPEEQRAAAELYSAYVGDMVFQEIREARGLAYSAYAWHAPGVRPSDASSVGGYIGTQSDKTILALTTLMKILRSLPAQPERFAKTKRKLDQRYRSSRVEPRTAVLWLASWEEAGFKSDPRPARWKNLGTTDEAAMMAFAEQFAQGDIIISIMGDADRFDVEALAKFGEVTVVKPSELFGY